MVVFNLKFLKIRQVLVVVGLLAGFANNSHAATCETDGPEGDWVEITEHVPEGNCLDTSYTGTVRLAPNVSYTFIEGKSERFRILVPTARTMPCLSGYSQSCNCNEWHDDAISKDVYTDCWGISERCSGSTCVNFVWGAVVQPPECTNCWSVQCWHITTDLNAFRRQVFEWVCDTCAEQYQAKLLECGEKKIINWDNETCTGQCDPCVEEYKAKIEYCGSVHNIMYWNDETCEGACLHENFGQPKCEN